MERAITFQPQMTSDITGFTVVGALKWRRWESGVADLWDVRCAEHAQGRYISWSPRLFVAVETQGKGDFLIDEGKGYRPHEGALSMSYIPAGCPVNARADRLTRLLHLDLHFDVSVLKRRFGSTLDAERMAAPRIAFRDDSLGILAKLIADECASEHRARILRRRSGDRALRATDGY